MIKPTKTPETKPHPINLCMAPFSQGIGVYIEFSNRSDAEYLDYTKGFQAAPFYFYFDVRGDALIVICKWGFGRASRWAWGHCSPHDWGRSNQLDGPIHPHDSRLLFINVGGDKLEPMGRILELPSHHYNPLQKVLSELYARPWTESSYYNELNDWVASREAVQLKSIETGENLTLERCLAIHARYGGILHDASPNKS